MFIEYPTKVSQAGEMIKPFLFLKEHAALYDLIISDLPDPVNESLARLYSDVFFKLCLNKLDTRGRLVSQATSPFYTPSAFWCIVETIKAAGFNNVRPYHCTVPSFGDWGFVYAEKNNLQSDFLIFPNDLRFIDSTEITRLFHFPKDQQAKKLKVNTMELSELNRSHTNNSSIP